MLNDYKEFRKSPSMTDFFCVSPKTAVLSVLLILISAKFIFALPPAGQLETPGVGAEALRELEEVDGGVVVTGHMGDVQHGEFPQVNLATVALAVDNLLPTHFVYKSGYIHTNSLGTIKFAPRDSRTLDIGGPFQRFLMCISLLPRYVTLKGVVEGNTFVVVFVDLQPK